MKIYLSNDIKIETHPNNVRDIINQFTFANPKYQEALNFGRSTRGIDRKICLVHNSKNCLTAPMGILGYLLQIFSPEVIDNRTEVSVDIPFTGKLRPYQETFVADAMKAQGGLMVAATGSGKTLSGIALASKLKQRTLILVKSKDLANQWQKAIKQFTGLEAGLMGGGKNTEGEQFTIGLTQTLSKRDLSLLNYGLVIADEVHNIAARQAYTVMNGLNSKYKFGLSATPNRRDNLEFLIHGVVGLICSVIRDDQLHGKVLPVSIRSAQIPFHGRAESWTEFLNMLVDSDVRNRILADIAVNASKKMGTAILTNQVRHCQLLDALCRKQGVDAIVLHGKLPSKVRAERMALAQGAPLIIGTLSLLSEGLDIPSLNALIFASPVSASIDKETPSATRLLQSIGRLRRPYPNKSTAFVLDPVDQCGFGVSAWNKRKHIYDLQGFDVKQLIDVTG